MFPRNFPVDGEAANLLRTCRLCCRFVVDLPLGSRKTCYGIVMGNWCNGFLAL